MTGGSIKPIEDIIDESIKKSKSRFDLWITFINHHSFKSLAEIGVLSGRFAAEILHNCGSINSYYMIDPWRHLKDWNKPANKSNETFQEYYNQMIENTAFAKEKRRILRGKTTEVIDQVPDESLDFAYIDGDHTLKGISIDLINIYPKIKNSGWIGGDDFCQTIWQHPVNFEPTLVFPFAIYFAEAVSKNIFALPHNQFLIQKNSTSYDFIDLIGAYREISLKNQFKSSTFLRPLKKILCRCSPQK